MKKTQNGKSQTPPPVPGYCYVLEGYLRGWAPATAPGSGAVLKTTQDIIDELSDMVEIDNVTLSTILAGLGFRVSFAHDGPHGWLMRRDLSASYTIRPAIDEPAEDD